MSRKRCPHCGRVHLENETVRKDKRTGDLQYSSAHKFWLNKRYLCRCKHCQGYYGVRGLSLSEYLLMFGLIALNVWLGKEGSLILIPIIAMILICQFCFPQEVPKQIGGEEQINVNRLVYDVKVAEGRVPPKGAILLWSRDYDRTELYSTPAPIRVLRTSSIHKKFCFEFIYDHQENEEIISGTFPIVYYEEKLLRLSEFKKVD